MFCDRCGHEIPPGVAACPSCPEAPGAAAFAPRQPVAMGPKKGLPWYFFAGLGFLALMSVAVFVGLIAFRIHLARKSSPMRYVEEAMCQMNLGLIGEACLQYEKKNHAWPPSLKALYESEKTLRSGTFICPAADGSPDEDARERPWKQFEDRVGYEYRQPPASIAAGGKMEIPMAWDKEEHSGGKRLVLYSSGRVESLDENQFKAKFSK
jgi:hypothetical protein